MVLTCLLLVPLLAGLLCLLVRSRRVMEALNVLAFAGALTRGQYGYGHSRAYLRQGNRAFMEAYANAFSMVQAKDPIYASHFPNLTKFIQQQFSTP
jgi:hypothetical protein